MFQRRLRLRHHQEVTDCDITMKDGSLSVVSPYDEEFVRILKNAIPANERRWNPEGRSWLVAVRHGKTIQDICDKVALPPEERGLKLDDGSGPTEYFACCVSVDAKNKREAKSLALKEDLMNDWIQWARDNNQNPFSGLKVENPVCEHGICWCDICKQECEECYKELDIKSEGGRHE